MPNNADKEKDSRIKPTDAKPDQRQKPIDTQQVNDVPEAAIENLEMVSSVIQENPLGDSTDGSAAQDNVVSDLKEDKTSAPSNQSLKDSEIPNVDAQQSAKPTPRIGILLFILLGILSGSGSFIERS